MLRQHKAGSLDQCWSLASSQKLGSLSWEIIQLKHKDDNRNVTTLQILVVGFAWFDSRFSVWKKQTRVWTVDAEVKGKYSSVTKPPSAEFYSFWCMCLLADFQLSKVAHHFHKLPNSNGLCWSGVEYGTFFEIHFHFVLHAKKGYMLYICASGNTKILKMTVTNCPLISSCQSLHQLT